MRAITLLVGRNSSGKSTFLRSLPLLRQSVERATTGPILWYGSLVDFGSHEAAVRRGAEEDGIRLTFRAGLEPVQDVMLTFYGDSASLLEPVTAEVEIVLKAVGEDAKTVATECRLRTLGDEVSLGFENGHVTRFVANDLDVLREVGPHVVTQSGGLIPSVLPIRAVRGPDGGPSQHVRDDTRAIVQLRKATNPFFYGNTSARKRDEAARNIGYGSREAMLRSMRTASDVPSWNQRVARLDAGSPRFLAVRSHVLARTVPLLLRLVDHAVSDFATSVSYSSPLRAAAERYYRKQDLAVGEIDPGGANLAMYLRSLRPPQAEAFQRWTREHLGFGVVASGIQDHVSLTVDVGGGHLYNLADMGFGFSQVLPVAAQIWDRTEGPGRGTGGSTRYGRRGLHTAVFAIEQPELHLHPALQARVADLLVRTVEAARRARVRVVFLVETHSSVIVNRIGQLIAGGAGVDASAVQVLLFEAETPNLSHVRHATYDARGVLRDWPYGFFEPDVVEPSALESEPL